MSDRGGKTAARGIHGLRKSVRRPHGRLCTSFLATLLVTTALTWPGGPAQAQCVTVGDTTNCTGNVGAGIVLDPAPAPNINVFNITGNIAPAAGTPGIFAETNGANKPLTIFIDIAPFEITTQGEDAQGIFAETNGTGSTLSLTNRGAITTQGNFSQGVFVQTFGADSTISLTNWGTITTQGEEAQGISALAFGAGSSLSVTNWGAITTQGEDAQGIFAQTFSAGNTLSITNGGAITTQKDGADGIFAQASDPNSLITLTNWGAVTTRGNDSVGIIVTPGNFSTTSLANHGAITTVGNRADGINADAGNFSLITLTNRGAITTQGNDAGGIVAKGGDLNTVLLTNYGAITTQGDNADGISAEGGNSSTLLVANWADVITNGVNADGIRAAATGMFSDVTVDLHGGLVQGGTGEGDGVELIGGTTKLNVFAGATVTTLGDKAVKGGIGNDTVNNWGTVTGSVDLGGGTNTFNNRAGGMFNAGPIVNLDPLADNLVSNAGTFAPGGVGTLQTTELIGDFTQTGSGVLATDLMFGSLTADLTNVSGTSILAGLVVPNIVNPGFTQLSPQQATILTSAGGVTNAGLTVRDTAVADYELLFEPTRVLLSVTVNFVPSGLNRNQNSVAEAITGVLSAGGSAALGPLIGGLLTLPDLASLADAYDQFGPGAYLGNGIATLFSSLDFADDLMSCEVREGGNVFIREGQCVWAEATGNWFNQDRTAETVDFDQVAPRIAGGFQAAWTPDWRFGMAFGYQRSNLEALNGRQDSEADTLHGGAVLKYLFGDALLAAAVSGGHGWYDTTRNFDFGGFAAQASASHGISHLTGRLRGAYAFTNGVHYVKPLVDLNVSWIGIDSFTESGGNGAALIVQRTDETVLSASPALEFGWQHWVEDGTLFRPYVRAGVTVFDDPELTLISSFAAAPAGAPSFRTVMGTDDIVGEVAVGLNLLTPGGTVLKAFYETQFGEDTRQQLAGIRASRPF